MGGPNQIDASHLRVRDKGRWVYETRLNVDSCRQDRQLRGEVSFINFIQPPILNSILKWLPIYLYAFTHKKILTNFYNNCKM